MESRWRRDMSILATLGVGKLLGAAVGMVGDWLGSKREMAAAKQTAKIAYLRTEQGFRHAWNVESIRASGKGMRWASFVLWSAPFVWAFIDPQNAQDAFSGALGAMPDWYIKGFLLVTAGVWGAKEFATLRELGKERKKSLGFDKIAERDNAR